MSNSISAPGVGLSKKMVAVLGVCVSAAFILIFSGGHPLPGSTSAVTSTSYSGSTVTVVLQGGRDGLGQVEVVIPSRDWINVPYDSTGCKYQGPDVRPDRAAGRATAWPHFLCPGPGVWETQTITITAHSSIPPSAVAVLVFRTDGTALTPIEYPSGKDYAE